MNYRRIVNPSAATLMTNGFGRHMAPKLGSLLVVVANLSAFPCPVSAQSLNYETFKSRVEPIFLEKRGDHARCYACHSQNNNGFHLERLSAGASFWTEAQSQKNFAAIANVVNPADPMSSPLLLHPLAPEAGGDAFHSGGRQFASKRDPDWQILAEFVRGQELIQSDK